MRQEGGIHMCEKTLVRINEFKLRGFKIWLRKHPDMPCSLFIVGIKDGCVVNLTVVKRLVASQYLKQGGIIDGN